MVKKLKSNINASDYALKISEDDLQKRCIDLLHTYGYRVAHFRPARVLKDGEETWRTPVSEDGAGFSDIVAAKSHRPLVVAELKSETGKLSPDQKLWDAVFSETPGIFYMVVKPSNYDIFEKYIIETN